MTTGFVTEYGGAAADLDSLFAPGATGQNTGFVSGYLGMDLGSRFAPLDAGARLPFNTGFIALNGLDLSDWFCANGTRVPDWPVGGGFLLHQAATETFVTDTVTALTGRMSWIINGDGSDLPNPSNLLAARFTPCPGGNVANAGLWQDFGGYVRGVTRRIPIGSVLRFEYGTINLPGFVTTDRTVGLGEDIPSWVGAHSGPPPFCSNVSPFINDPINVADFSPGPGFWYGAYCTYMNISGSKAWQLVLSAGFCCSTASGHLGEQRIYVTRIS